MKINISLPRNVIFLLSSFFVLGIILRFFALSSFPNGFSRDEAFLGYNAFSILVTGRDINSHFLPLFLESFLYTPAGYAYFSIPFIKLFGLSIFSVRFASALFGSLSIPAIFFLTKSLLSFQQDKKITERLILFMSLASSFLLAITPWHINLSRTASVSTLVTFFIILGCYFFIEWIRTNNKKLLFLSFAGYFISLFFYIAPFSFLPLFILISYFLFKKHITKNKKTFIALYVLFLVPVLFVLLSPTLSLRVQTLSITKNPLVKLILIEDTGRDGVFNIPPLVALTFHNKLIVISDIFLQNYFSHFTYNYLFRDNGYPERFKIPESGLLFPVYLIFIAMGIYYLFRSEGNIKWFLIGWILLGPIGSGFASDDVPNLQRTLFMLPPILIVSAYGIAKVLQDLSKKGINKLILILILIIVLLYEFITYLHLFYYHENAYRPWYRQDGYQDLISKINRLKNSYSKVVVTNRESAPTIFLLFFNKYDPASMQKTVAKSILRDTDRISFSNYEITQEECPLRVELDPKTGIKNLMGQKGMLYVNSGFCKNENLPSNVKILDTVYRADGSKVFLIMTIQ